MPDIQPTSLTTEELYRYAMLKRYKNEALPENWQDAILEALRKAIVALDVPDLFDSSN
jgi:hypothetical protein